MQNNEYNIPDIMSTTIYNTKTNIYCYFNLIISENVTPLGGQTEK